MADRTGIQWTDATWNPIVGCSLASPGCTNCYAMGMAARIEAMQPRMHYAGTTMPGKAGAVWTGKVALAPDHILTQPLRWRRPRTIFVNSMGDLFHPDAPDAWIDRVFAVMALCPHHTFQVLTKRGDRMRQYLHDRARRYDAIYNEIFEGALSEVPLMPLGNGSSINARADNLNTFNETGALLNVWLGVSAEDQHRADERIPDLLATPAAIRFVSAEPLLGPVDLRSLPPTETFADKPLLRLDGLTGHHRCGPAIFGDDDMPRIDLIIVGGENGPRPMHPDWARSLRDQCADAGTAFFFKQWGSWEPAVDRERDDPDWRLSYSREFGDSGATKWLNLAGGCGFHGERFHVMRRVGKARAGRLLDGREHNELPSTRTQEGGPHAAP